MPIRSCLVALAATVLVALPLRAQRADSSTAVRTAPIVIAAEAPSHDVRSLMRGNRVLANELRRYDRQEAALQTRLDSLKQVAATREQAILALNDETAALRAQRLELEARLARIEATSAASPAKTERSSQK